MISHAFTWGGNRLEKRYEQLDSLRGIAAMLVFIFHMLMILPNSWKKGLIWKIIYFSPLHHLLIGDKRVIFFYILSGFVLSLPFLRNKSISYPAFIIKRIIRLYIPYAVAISFAVLTCINFSNGRIEDLGDLFNELWMAPTDAGLIASHYLFIGNYDVYAYNISIWSLIHELRISFIFPLLITIAIRYGWKINMAIGAGLAVIGAAIHLVLVNSYQPFYKTLFYILMFIIGILISKNRLSLLGRYHSISKRSKIGLLILGYLIYNYSDFIGNPLLADWLTSIGVSILLIIALGSVTILKILLWKPFTFIGKISYGIYLYHLPILLTSIHILYGKLSIVLIFGLAIIVTIVISILTLYLIERPSVKLAKYLSEYHFNRTKRSVLIEGRHTNL